MQNVLARKFITCILGFSLAMPTSLLAQSFSQIKNVDHFKRSLIKSNPQAYFELTEKIRTLVEAGELNADSDLTEIKLLAETIAMESDESGLAFASLDRGEAITIFLVVILILISVTRQPIKE